MNDFLLIFTNDNNKIVKTNDPDYVMNNLYYQKCILSPNNDPNTKTNISKNLTMIPLYDVYSENLYLIGKDNVYSRVVYQHYRFPTQELYDKLKKTKENKNFANNKDPLIRRKYDKLILMLNFLECYDLNELYKTYMTLYYLYSDEVGQNMSICKRPSFISHFSHLIPYYSRKDVINIALNMGYDTHNNTFEDTCEYVINNDIRSDILLKHQSHMINTDRVGLVQYYTLHGSFYMNQYLRNMTPYDCKNEFMESLITPMWDLILSSPSFDREYTLYRHVSNDSYINHLKIGDIYTEESFISTTRDPFYRPDLYKFGHILIKIRIPKDIKGVALCVETLSHFKEEQEIILAPKSKLRLECRNNDCKYFYSNDAKNTENNNTLDAKIKYEFTFVGHDDKSYIDRPPAKVFKTINFINLSNDLHAARAGMDVYSLEERIRIFTQTALNEMSQFKVIIGTKPFVVIADRYNSTGAYRKFYAKMNQNGFMLYTMYNNYVLFLIEIGEINNGDIRYMHVNYYVKYSTIEKNDLYNDEDFITFISSVAYYFDIQNITLYAEFKTCDIIKDDKDIIINIPKQEYKHKNIKDINTKNQRNYDTDIYTINSSMNKSLQKARLASTVQDNEQDFVEEIMGGTYCVDIYLYLTKGIKKYDKLNSLELQPKYSYTELDKLKYIKPDAEPYRILRKEDQDELYRIYTIVYDKTDNDNVVEFYNYIITKKCYLIETLISKMKRLYVSNNPFDMCSYRIDPVAYLYNRGKIHNSNLSSKDLNINNIIRTRTRDVRKIQINDYRS